MKKQRGLQTFPVTLEERKTEQASCTRVKYSNSGNRDKICKQQKKLLHLQC